MRDHRVTGVHLCVPCDPCEQEEKSLRDSLVRAIDLLKRATFLGSKTANRKWNRERAALVAKVEGG